MPLWEMLLLASKHIGLRNKACFTRLLTTVHLQAWGMQPSGTWGL